MESLPDTDAVGRTRVCSECRKPLPDAKTAGDVTELVCENCGSINRAKAKLKIDSDDKHPSEIASALDIELDKALEKVASEVAFRGESKLGGPQAEYQLMPDVGDVASDQVEHDPHEDALDSDFNLQPALSTRNGRLPHATPRELAVEHPPFGIVSEDASSLGGTGRTEKARDRYNETGGLYPRERHYPTLEAMQRLYVLFGYAAVLIVFPYLFVRLVYIFWTTDEGLFHELAAFSEFAVPVIFGTVALVGTLFAAAEGLQLAIDLQDNTLRIANRNGRRRS